MRERVLTDKELKRTFLAVVRHGSMGGAAREMNLTLPGVKYRIDMLEQESGQVLFTRLRGRGVELTDVGQATVRILGGG